jgi:DNA-directed RNA polymerase specialized sigma24 family protein
VRREVKEPIFEAFQLNAIGGLSAEQVAKQLGISVDAVCAAKKRVLSRVRELAKKQEQIS